MNDNVELEVCANCKREIPHYNYVMHTAHCSRNMSLCGICKEPIPKSEFVEHGKTCMTKIKPGVTTTKIEQSSYFAARREVEDRKEKVTHVAQKAPQPPKDLLPCQYCEIELPKFDLGEHETYCGARTERCQECGEIVMFKYRQLHLDSNHGYLGPRPPQRTAPDFVYNPPGRSLLSTTSSTGEKLETSKEISRRLDCKTEYIRNLLHESASVTAPIRSTGAVPRYRQADKPSFRRNPPSVLVIPCEFCDTPIPHEDLVEHETGCRPDLARYNTRRGNDDSNFLTSPVPGSPDVELPCEFCSDLIPASQLLSHQAACN